MISVLNARVLYWWQMGKTKVDSHSWKTRITSGVSLIAAGTLESRNTAMKGRNGTDRKHERENMPEHTNCHLPFFLFFFLFLYLH